MQTGDRVRSIMRRRLQFVVLSDLLRLALLDLVERRSCSDGQRRLFVQDVLFPSLYSTRQSYHRRTKQRRLTACKATVVPNRECLEFPFLAPARFDLPSRSNRSFNLFSSTYSKSQQESCAKRGRRGRTMPAATMSSGGLTPRKMR